MIPPRQASRLLAAALLLLPACAARLPRPPPAGPISSPAELFWIASLYTGGLRDMEARARVKLRIDGVRQKGAAVLFYRAPGRLKLDIQDTLLGIGIMSARAQAGSLAVYLPRDNRYLEGAPEDVLYKLTGVNLAYYGAKQAILGLPNLSSLSLPRVDRFEARGDSLFVSILDPLWTRLLRFDRRTATMHEEQVYTPRGILLSRRLLSDYRDEGGVVLPRRMAIVQGNDRIEVEILRRNVNAGFPDARFNLNVPADVIRLGAQEAP